MSHVHHPTVVVPVGSRPWWRRYCLLCRDHGPTRDVPREARADALAHRDSPCCPGCLRAAPNRHATVGVDCCCRHWTPPCRR